MYNPIHNTRNPSNEKAIRIWKKPFFSVGEFIFCFLFGKKAMLSYIIVKTALSYSMYTLFFLSIIVYIRVFYILYFTCSHIKSLTLIFWQMNISRKTCFNSLILSIAVAANQTNLQSSWERKRSMKTNTWR